MCAWHGCCDHGIHSERNTPTLRYGPDRSRQSVFGSVLQTPVSQPREVTRLTRTARGSDRHDRRDNSLHSRSENHMNSRPDAIGNAKHVTISSRPVVFSPCSRVLIFCIPRVSVGCWCP